jgi:hypothetical protein
MSKRPSGLSVQQRNFLSLKEAGAGKNFRMSDYERGHHKALGEGHRANTKPYFKAVGDHADRISGSRKQANANEFDTLRKNATSNYFPKKK